MMNVRRESLKDEVSRMRKPPLPIGIEFYKHMMDKPYYYVDKTLIIRDLLDKGGKVNLFTRPRRFGKTLIQSTLRVFFECETEADGSVTDNSHYFAGAKIMQAGEEYVAHMGQYPVIFLSLKSAKQPNFQMAYEQLRETIAEEFERHAYLLKIGGMSDGNREKYRELMERRAQRSDYATALHFLSKCLKRYHGKDVVILIDEYDVPLENAHFRGFYDEMIDFIRSLFESALKTNECLELAVITGCLRISRESIFTGLNNLKAVSVLDESFAEYFGFTPSEVKEMLEYYGIGDREEEVRRWYDGYLFGQTEVYNPWSVINYVDDITSKNTPFPKPYWSNTSSNNIVRELVDRADDTVKSELEELIAGGAVEKPVHEEITYGEVYKSQDNLWNFLFFTGYLKVASRRFAGNTVYLTLTIPNEEICYIYQNTIREWFEERKKEYDPTPFYDGMRSGDCSKVEEFISSQLSGSISYYDSTESFYHGYLLGLLGGMGGYKISSNREQGNGRPDLLLEAHDPRRPSMIIEIKRARKFSEMEGMCDEALAQIERQDYAAELLDEGYQKIYQYGFCFCKKSCMVKFSQIGDSRQA